MAATTNYSLHLMCSFLNRKAYHENRNVYIHRYKDKNILVFRGTYDTESLMYSFHLWEKKNLHKGYKTYSDVCKAEVQSLGVDFSKPLVITGHSLGSIAGALVAHELDIDAEVVMFGSPKLATSEFRKSIQKNKKLKIYNYINEGDICASYPFIYYEHLSEPIILDSGATFINPLTYHSMKTYSHNIRTLKNDARNQSVDIK